MKNSPSSASSPNNPPDPARPVHELRERVRYSETDRMGVAHNKSYFEWFELGRTEFCRSRGLPYLEIEDRGVFLVVAEASCRYLKPLRYDDEFVVRVTLEEAAGRKVVFGYEIRSFPEDKHVASGRTVHVPVDRDARVCALPEDILRKITGEPD